MAAFALLVIASVWQYFGGPAGCLAAVRNNAGGGGGGGGGGGAGQQAGGAPRSRVSGGGRVGGPVGGASRGGQGGALSGALDDDDDEAELLDTARVMAASAAEAGTPMTVQEALASLRGDDHGIEMAPAPAPAPAPSQAARGSGAKGGNARGLRLGSRLDEGSDIPASTVAAAAAAAAADPFATGTDSWDIDFDEHDGAGATAQAEQARAREMQYTSNAVAVGGTLPEEDAGGAAASLGRLAPVRFQRKASEDDDLGFDDDW